LEEVVKDATLVDPEDAAMEEDPDYGLKPAASEMVSDGASLGLEGTAELVDLEEGVPQKLEGKDDAAVDQSPRRKYLGENVTANQCKQGKTMYQRAKNVYRGG
jgi:hypothetical protein